MGLAGGRGAWPLCPKRRRDQSSQSGASRGPDAFAEAPTQLLSGRFAVDLFFFSFWLGWGSMDFGDLSMDVLIFFLLAVLGPERKGMQYWRMQDWNL